MENNLNDEARKATIERIFNLTKIYKQQLNELPELEKRHVLNLEAIEKNEEKGFIDFRRLKEVSAWYYSKRVFTFNKKAKLVLNELEKNNTIKILENNQNIKTELLKTIEKLIFVQNDINENKENLRLIEARIKEISPFRE